MKPALLFTRLAVLGGLIFPCPGTAQAMSINDAFAAHDIGPDRGIAAGSFLLTPAIGAGVKYDDNIFLSHSNAVSDIISDVAPSVSLQSDWKRHQVYFKAEGDFGFYKKSAAQNFMDYGFLFSGKYDLAQETWLTLGAVSVSRHQNLDLQSSLTANQPLSYQSNGLLLGFTRALSRLKLKVDGTAENITLASDTGIALAGNDLRRKSYHLNSTLSYDYMPDNGFFASAGYNTTNYMLRAGDNFTSAGEDLRAGWNFSKPDFLKGSLYGGYLLQSYNNGSADTRNPHIGGTLTWQMSALMSSSLYFDHTFIATNTVDAAGVVQTTRQFSLSRSFTPRMESQFTFGVNDNQYVGGTAATDFSTRVYYGSLSGKYQLSDHFDLKADYSHQSRVSDREVDAYKDNRIYLSLVYKI